MSETAETQIKQAVRRKYAELAVLNESCCKPGAQASTGDAEVPKESLASAASCGSPVNQASLHEGDIVLDLGSGGGIDAFRASKLVGSSGKVIGVDSTPEMIWKARQVAAKYDYGNVEFRLGEIEHLPVESSSVDVAISNCVLNLVPDKTLAFKEIFRTLKPGGRIAISDMVATRKIEDEEKGNLEDWAACLSGAVTVEEYRRLLDTTGFQDVLSIEENSPMDCCSSNFPVKSLTWIAMKPRT